MNLPKKDYNDKCTALQKSDCSCYQAKQVKGRGYFPWILKDKDENVIKSNGAILYNHHPKRFSSQKSDFLIQSLFYWSLSQFSCNRHFLFVPYTWMEKIKMREKGFSSILWSLLWGNVVFYGTVLMIFSNYIRVRKWKDEEVFRSVCGLLFKPLLYQTFIAILLYWQQMC